MKLTISLASTLTLVTVGGVATHASFNDSGTTSVTGSSATFIWMGSASGNTRPEMYYTYTDLISSPKTLPGVSNTSSFTVSNPHSFPIEYKLTQSFAQNLDVAKLIPITVKKGNTVIYTGTYGDFTMSYRTLAPGESEIFSSTVTWPTSAVSSATRGKALTANLTLLVTQK